MKIPSAYFQGMGQRVPTLSAGPKPDPSPGVAIGESARRLGDTIANIAYDQGMEKKREFERLQKLKQESEARSALFAHENTLSEVAQQIAADSQMSPEQKRDQFRTQADQVRSTFLQSVPEEYQYAFGPSFEQHTFQAEAALDTHIRKSLQDDIRAAGTVAREQLLNSPKPLDQKLAILKDPAAFDWEAEGWTEDQRAKEVERLAELATEAAIEERFNQEDPKQVLTDLRAQNGDTFAHYGDLSPKTRQAYIRTARSLIDQQARDAERRDKEAKAAKDKAAQEAFERYKEMREGLFPIDPAAESNFWKLVSGTEYEEKARDVRKATGALGYVTGKVKEDPLKYGSAQLGLDIPPLSMDDPAAWPQQIEARGKVAGLIKSSHGLNYLPVLTNDEAKGLAGIFQAQAPQAQVQTVKGLQQALGRDSLQQIARQFAAIDPDLGTTISLAVAGRDKAAFHVADGRRLMQEKAVPLAAAVKTDMRSEFEDTMREALAGMPQARESFFRAAEAAYTSLLGSRGGEKDAFDDDLFEEALQMVIGGAPVKINGKRVLPPDGMTEDAFLTRWKSLSATQVREAGGVMGFTSDADAVEEILDDAELWEAGAGRYRFAIDGKFLLVADGSRPFELNLSDQVMR